MRRLTVVAGIGVASVLLAAAAAARIATSGYVTNGVPLQPADAAGKASIGSGVVLSADGSVMLVAAEADNPTGAGLGETLGAVFSYVRAASTYRETQKLSPPAGIVQFGTGLGLSCDGSTALINGFPLYSQGQQVGPNIVSVYNRSGMSWVQAPSIDLPQGWTAGRDVALSCDGGTALISGTGADYTQALLYHRQGSSWALTDTLNAGGTRWIDSVALSGDGQTAALGLSGLVFSNDGAVAIFGRSGSAWSEEATVSNPDPEPYQPEKNRNNPDTSFATSVALSSDGNTLLVNAPNDGIGTRLGNAFVFSRNSSGQWSPQSAKLPAGEAVSSIGSKSTKPLQATVGYSVALTGDGNTALIGSIREQDGVGEAPLVYTRVGSTWTQAPQPILPTPRDSETKNPFDLSTDAWAHEGALSADGKVAAIGDNNYQGTLGGVLVFDYGPINTTSTGSTSSPGTTARCVVPHLTGRTVAAATKALVAAHCSLGTVTHASSSTVKRGLIISQHPSAGARLATKSRVNVVVSRGHR